MARSQKKSEDPKKAKSDKQKLKAARSSAEPSSRTRPSTLPRQLEPDVDAPAVETRFGTFDLDDPVLPDWVEKAALKSGSFPYNATLKNKTYAAELEALQIELVKLQHHIVTSGLKVIVLFEGRDAAGKGGAIASFREYLNPRNARDVALPKPSETERGQWYFQRYVAELPSAGEIVTFDRSWYNRAGVEKVMGFCTSQEHAAFLKAVSPFETLLVDAGLIVFKFWLEIGREMQMKRFHERRHNPLKIWKLSPMDYAALGKWADYSKARDEMLAETHSEKTPWTVVLANDKRRARLDIIRHVLGSITFPGRDDSVIGKPDPRILGQGLKFLRDAR